MLNLSDIENYEYVEEEFVYDIEIEDNHNYYINARKEILVHNSSKTFSTIQLIKLICQFAKKQSLTSIVAESFPHIRRGVYRDFEMIMGDDFNHDRINKTNYIYDFEFAMLEFFSADDSKRLRGGRRDHLFINECNNVTKASFDELYIRTFGTTWLDFNPTSEFWVHELLASYGIHDYTKSCFPKEKDICYIHSTYLDAKSVLELTPEGRNTIQKIEARKNRDPNWWRVYGLGLVGKLEGLVHPKFEIIDEMPPDDELDSVFYGLDFGFSNHPTAFVKCGLKGLAFYSKQLIYSTGLTNQDIGREFERLGIKKHYDEIYADDAEPKSIEEIYQMNYNIKRAEKGLIQTRIQLVNQYDQYITKDSVDLIKEIRNYRYIEDKNGKLTNKPIDDWNHGLDGRGYALIGKKGNNAAAICFSAL